MYTVPSGDALTHEDATDEEKMPYLAIRCRPMVVKEFFGRAAKKDPPCPISYCIWWWWKDFWQTKACYEICTKSHVELPSPALVLTKTVIMQSPAPATPLFVLK